MRDYIYMYYKIWKKLLFNKSWNFIFNDINFCEWRKIKWNLKFKIIMNVLIKEFNEIDIKLLKLMFIKLLIFYF